MRYWILIALTVGWLGGYMHHYVATADDRLTAIQVRACEFQIAAARYEQKKIMESMHTCGECH